VVSDQFGAPAILWDGASGNLVAALGSYKQTLVAATRSPDGRILAQTLERPLPNGAVSKVWDLGSGALLASGSDPRDGKYRVTDVAPDGERLAEMDERGTVVVRDARTRQPLASFDTGIAVAGRRGSSNPLSVVAFAKGRLLTIAEKELGIWDARDGKQLYKVGDPRPILHATAGDFVAIGACDQAVVYNTMSGERAGSAPSKIDNCNGGLAVSMDGTMLLSLAKGVEGIGLTEARLWRLRDGSSAVLTGYDDGGSIGAFSPDGKTIATAGPKGTINFWDTVTSRRLLTLEGFGEEVSSLRLSDSGDMLIAGYGTQVRLWRAPPDPSQARPR
jgi:WD40 repeat protein